MVAWKWFAMPPIGLPQFIRNTLGERGARVCSAIQVPAVPAGCRVLGIAGGATEPVRDLVAVQLPEGGAEETST